MRVYMYVCLCLFVCVCVYVCMCVDICVCVYVFIQDPDPESDPGSDPKLCEKSDPDPDPKKIIPDPQHCWGEHIARGKSNHTMFHKIMGNFKKCSQ